MKKKIRITLFTLGTVFVLISALLIYVKFALPNVGPAPKLHVDDSEEFVERGRYLANNVMVCMDCHSTRDWTQFAGPPIEGTWGMGGEKFDQTLGFPGAYYAKNITPFALSSWTDGEIYRAIVSGVSKDGSALFPIMPHPNYGELDTKDIYAVIAYLRTLKPIINKVPVSVSDFPMNFIINTIPKKASPRAIPDTNNSVQYGKYLFTAASCNGCHTKRIKGKPVKGMELAGGFEVLLPTGIVRSANITPDKETGIGRWTEAGFVARFKTYSSDKSEVKSKLAPGQFNTFMPWTMYAKMKSSDLAAIYNYLKTIKPITNEVEHFTPKKE